LGPAINHVVSKPLRLESVAIAALGAALAAALSCLPTPPGPCRETCDGNLRRACGTWDRDNSPGDGIEDCGSRTCVEAPRTYGYYAACAIGGVRDPRCNADNDATFCDGERVASCHGAFRVDDFDCAADGRVCETIVANGFSARHACVRSHEREPQCETDGGGQTTFCEENSIVLCFGGFVSQSAPCDARGGANRRCVEGSCVR